MKLAKVLFTIAVVVFYAAWAMGMHAVWQALTLPQFILALAAYLPVATFLLFLAGMVVERGENDHHVPELAAYLVKLLWPIAGLHNLANNVLTMTLVCLDLPREGATTKRMNRYADGPDGWRRRLALFVREQLLNWADPDGIHT